MDRLTAFELLGLSPGADAKAIKRAYHKRLKTTKPDRDPEGFKRLRAAFEAATSDSAMDGFYVPDRPSEAARCEVDAAVVWDALEGGELQRAHSLVMDERWADAMLDDPDGGLEWTTREVGLRLVLVHRAAFDALAAKYPAAFTGDERLGYLLRISNEWSRIADDEHLPAELAEFVCSLGADEEQRRQSGQALGAWLVRDLVANVERLRPVLAGSPDFASLLESNAGELADDLDESPVDPRLPRRALRPLTLAVSLGSVVAALSALVPHGGGVLAAPFLLVIKAVMLVGFVHYAEGHAYDSFSALRHRFLVACIDANLEPHLAASRLRVHPFLRKAILDDAAINVAFHVARLARLEVER